MKHLVLIFTIVSASCAAAGAKTKPQFAYTTVDSVGTKNEPLGDFVGAAYKRKFQSIYYPSDFAGMPAGNLKNLYFRTGTMPIAPPPFYQYFGFRIHIKNTSLTQFPNVAASPKGIDTLIPINQSDLVANYSAFFIDSSSAIRRGDWIRVPLNTKLFNYTRLQNFIVQLEIDSVAKGVLILGFSHSTDPFYSCLSGIASDSTLGYGWLSLIDLGFDLASTGVEASSNLISFGLFPNPASDGRFNVSFEVKNSVRDVRLSATSITGQQVWSDTYHNVGNSFFRRVDLNTLAKGMYFIRVNADGESLTRRVMIE